jgi:hypothetical protein
MLYRVSWHQCLRNTFEGLSDLAATPFASRKGTLFLRYYKLLVSFAISGYIHIACDLALGHDLAKSGSMQFFMTQAAGIMLEDAVQAIYYSVSGEKKIDPPPLWRKIVGYVWVIVFAVWSTPVWSFPMIRGTRMGKDYILAPLDPKYLGLQ